MFTCKTYKIDVLNLSSLILIKNMTFFSNFLLECTLCTMRTMFVLCVLCVLCLYFVYYAYYVCTLLTDSSGLGSTLSGLVA